MQGKYAVIPVMQTEDGYTISDRTLKLIWETIVDEGKMETVFYNGAVKNAGDFVHYLRREDVYPVVVYDVDKEKFTGLAWVNNLNEGTAQCHFCTFNVGQQSPGEPVLMGHEVLSFWHKFPTEVLGVLVGIVPATNEKAVEYAEKLGFTNIGEIPNYCNTVYMESRSPGVVMYKELGG